MANGRVVKYKEQYLITIEGSTDTAHPEDRPFGLQTAESILVALATSLDSQYKSRNVTVEKVS